MRYVCLTCDYDGTLARNGGVASSTIQGLEKVRASGRKLILATGRELDDLLKVFPDVSLFDRVVAENGGLLYRPSSKQQVLLSEPPSKKFVEELSRRGVQPLSVGRCVVATWHPNETTVLDVIREMNLELQIIFNKNAVMILPSGVNKGTGLQAALNELQLSYHNVVGVGDAENDHAFMSVCEACVAVSNALPGLKERADWVTAHSHGAGVEEVIQGLLKACEKRPVSVAALETIADRVEATLQERPEREIATADVGAFVMEELKKLDKVAYVRFASVYRHFRDIGEFMNELKDLLNVKD